jgi:hypothetical protein
MLTVINIERYRSIPVIALFVRPFPFGTSSQMSLQPLQSACEALC